MKNIFIIVLFCCCAGNIFAQQFEGELIWEGKDSAGKAMQMKMYGKKDRVRMFGVVAETPIDFYVTRDSLTIVFSTMNYGLKFCRDSAVVFFKEASGNKTPTDSLLSIEPSTKNNIISGFHCSCSIAQFRSGLKREFWITTEVDSDICRSFYESDWLNFWTPSDGTAKYISDLNKNGKFIIYSRDFNEDGRIKNEMTLLKFAKRPIGEEEIDVPANINIYRLNPQQVLDASAKNKKKEGKK